MKWIHSDANLIYWHRTFAWWPVRTPAYTVWLSMVWRREIGSRGSSGDRNWQYSWRTPSDD